FLYFPVCYDMRYLALCVILLSVCCSLCDMRPSACSTLFPYTTLFRSSPSSYQVSRQTCLVTTFGRYSCLALRMEWAASFLVSVSDRKSTRLNSSHVSISYAVFCLKKKIGKWNPWSRTEQ